MKLVELETLENEITGQNTIATAMQRLDEVSIKILFLIDENRKLIATLTDGDIRRALLNGYSLADHVIDVANMNPRVLKAEDDIKKAADYIKNRIVAVPRIDEHGRLLSLIICERGRSFVDATDRFNLPVIVMAGGKGTRLYPYTKILPKPLIPVDDIPISERIINSFIKYGCSRFYMVVNYKKNMIKSYFADSEHGNLIEFVDETTPLGTGGGIKLLEGKIDGTFILTNCDILIEENLHDIVKHHKNNNNVVTMVCSLKNYTIPYGVVKFEEGGEISSFEEKPKMSFFTNTGYYILEDKVLGYIEENESIGMPDIIDRVRQDGLKVGIYPISENSWLDMGQFDTMEGMERRLREIEGQWN